MKKILTLMAAMSAASGALAHDYNWTGLQNPTVDKNNEVKDCAGLTFANNTFTFEVDAMDAITLNVNGDNISVSLDGTNLKTTTENGKITFTASNKGKVTVTLGENTAVTKIVVVSDYTVQMNKLIADAQAELKDATGKTAQYSNLKNGEYFTKVRAGINEQGKKIESIIAAFETAKEKDEVGTKFEAWEAELKTNIPNALVKIVADAATCKAKYDQILGLAGNARAQLAKFGTNVPTNKDVKTADLAAAYNNGINSIYNFAANKDGDNKNATNVGAKTSWIVAAHNAYANKAISAIEDAAYAELCSQFPNTITTDYQTKYYDAAVVAEQNMIARAVIEGDSNLGYKAKIDALNNNISNIETVVAKGDPFKLPAEANLDFTTLKENVSQLAAFISSTNYYEYSLGEMKNMLESSNSGSYKYAKDAYDGIIAAFINQAKTALNAEIETVDKLIKDYAYKVSAKYQNEPATQKTYEKKFAELQTRLDNVKNVVAAGDFAKVVTEYDARLKEINDITPEVKALWDETCGEQVTAVRNNNTKAQDALNTTIDSIRKDIYDKYVNKIVEWKAADATKAVAGELDVNLKNLFSIVGGLDVQKQNIQEYMDKLNTAIDGAIAKDGEAAFDPNNNIYRFAQDSINSFNAQIEAIKKGINSEIKKAVYTANFQAAKYLLNYSGEYDDINTYESVDRTIISKVDQTGSEWEQGNLYAGKNGELMSAAAQDKFTKAYNSIRRKDENGNGEGLLNEAFNVIASKCLSVYNATADQIEAQDITKLDLADKVKDIQEKYFAKAYSLIDSVDTELASYKEQYKVIGAMKVEWTETKANENTYQADADKVAKGEIDVKAELEAINKKVEDALAALEKVCTKASTQKDATDKVAKEFDEVMFKVKHFGTLKANEATTAIANAKVIEVQKVIDDAREAVKEYKDGVQTEANQSFDAAQVVLNNISADITTAIENRTIDAEYNAEGGIKSKLDGVVDEVNEALKKAAEDNKGADIDYNGDGVVDANDAKAAKADAQKTGDIKTFNDFLTKYLEFQSK